MKVLILGYEYPPVGGGTGQALKSLLEEWRNETDMEIELWTARPPRWIERTLPPGIRISEVWCAKKKCHYWTTLEQVLLLWGAWRRSLRDDPLPDVLVIWGGWPLGLLLFGTLKQVPSILALRGSDVPGFNPRTSGPFWRFLCRRIWKRATLLTTNSPFLAAMARNVIPRLSLQVIPNGVDSVRARKLLHSRDRPAPREKESWRILSANRLIRRKRVDWLIRAVSHLPCGLRKRLDVVIAGDGPERYRLETIAHELAVEESVRFLGEVPPEEMPDLYLDADLFVLASEAEGLSNSLLEALSFGLPALVATPTGFSDIDQTVLPIGDDRTLAEGIEHLIMEPSAYEEQSRRSLETASRYAWPAVAREYKRLTVELHRQSLPSPS